MIRWVLIMLVVAASFATATAHGQDVDFLFALADGNHDLAIDAGEAHAFAVEQWRSMDLPERGSVTREAILKNPVVMMLLGDLVPAPGVALSRQQFFDDTAQRFKRADADGNGTLDTAEFRAFLGVAPQRSIAQASGLKLDSLAEAYKPGLPSCASLGRDPADGLAGKKGVSALIAKVIPANSMDAAYCFVQFVYDSGLSGPKDGYDNGQSQAITIRIGLPLRPDDGGGPVPWNGRIQNVGSGGCMGSLPSVTIATNAGFASASSDGGHGAPWIVFNCGFGVIQAKHELNKGLIRDFSAEHVRWQTLWSKALVKTYYGQGPKRTYWCGCSQGGREGFIALETMPEEYDGILAGGAALYWMRFQMAQSWSGVVIKDMLRVKGKDLTAAQIARTVEKEVAACDALDGLKDGELADPRTCQWSARAAVCKPGETSADGCLDADQAAAFDTIRRGPRNHRGEMIWFPWEPGTTFSNQTNYLLSDGVMQWAVRDLAFSSNAHLYMDAAALQRSHDARGISYEDMAALASQRVSDLADMDDVAVDRAAKSGVKMLAWTGTADRNIQSRNTIKFYRDAAAHLGQKVDDEALQTWFRVFLYPSVDHCAGGTGPQPGNIVNGPLFVALVKWVEQGQVPERILATKRDASGTVVRTRPVCAYPKSATYTGKGSMDEAANFRCEGDLETGSIVAADGLATHKKENGTGEVPASYR